ncbi:MAG: NAD(P)/FAD-dependent oxidoreductase [Chthoniobacterales bacterium]|jgi:pyruvate/2-oxoglutarate dehydrogenase complex dihydrolipoamide dehydrogenase (E3) component|nr:NAD(P)/FAD-dependent oxidoreductase [Chthoniobacterales bacterium]
MSDFDFVVVGGGSAGYAAARTAAGEGLRTAVIDGSEELGGLCILRGCMPSKTLIETANRLQDMREAPEFGLKMKDAGFDGAKIIERKRRLVAEFARYRAEQLEGGNFEMIRGHARFFSPDEVTVRLRGGGERNIRSRAILVATGSVVRHPDIPGLAEAKPLTSDEVLDNEHPPKSLIVLGAGPVALEMAHYHRALGADVTVVQRSRQVLSSMDRDAADAVQHGMERRGTKFVLGCKILRAGRSPRGKWVRVAHDDREDTIEADEILLALGRDPATAGLGLGNAGINVADGRPLATTGTQQTSVPHIFGAGDVTGELEIVHIAIEQGEIAARNAARLLRDEAQPETIDYRLRLFAVFTQPEAAMVGLTEREAAGLGLDFAAATYPFADHGKAMVNGKTDGFVKLIADRKTGQLIGGAVVGAHASELIHEVVVAMRYRATAAEFLKIPHYHPTLSEIWTYPAEELAG